MVASGGIKEVIKVIEKLVESGQQEVSVTGLLQYLKKVDQTTVTESDLLRLQHESDIAHYEAENAQNIEMLRSVFETSKGALKSSILVNGGACVALISLISKEGALSAISKCWFTYGLTAFATGVGLGVIASGTAYLTQYCYWDGRNKTGKSLHIFTIALILATYASFAYGILASYHALLS